MAQSTHKSYFTSEEIRSLQRAFETACAELGLTADDRARRERLGALVFEVAKAGAGDEATLKAEAVRRFQDAPMAPPGAEAGLAVGVAVTVEEGRLPSRLER